MAKYSMAILGAGNVGASLARVWVAAGHAVTFGVPNPHGDKVRAAVAALGGKAKARRTRMLRRPRRLWRCVFPGPRLKRRFGRAGIFRARC